MMPVVSQTVAAQQDSKSVTTARQMEAWMRNLSLETEVEG